MGETKSWSCIPTAYPWLYPHGYMSDTSFIKAKSEKPSIKASCLRVFALESLFLIFFGKARLPNSRKKKDEILNESPRFSAHLMSLSLFGLLASSL